jgi:hypothetical protein
MYSHNYDSGAQYLPQKYARCLNNKIGKWSKGRIYAAKKNVYNIPRPNFEIKKN